MAALADIVAIARDRIVAATGGPARLQIILVLGAILGLDAADKGTISAVAGPLERGFGIGNTGFGLLLAVVSFVGAVGTLPMGILADRVARRHLLMAAVALWGVAMILSGLATSYAYMMATRVVLGLVTAAAWPCVASLSGDFFPARDRPGIFGMIVAGELAGAGIGFVISTGASALIDWHWAFFVMSVPAFVLVWVIWRYLPEPERGTQTWLAVGETDPAAASPSGPHHPVGADELSPMQETARRAHVRPRPALVLRQDPTRLGWLPAMRYLLRLPTYRLLIAASALAYYFFSGARAFAMIYFTRHDHASRGTVALLVIVFGAGALFGVVAGGTFSEWLRRRGMLNARILLPAATLALSVPLLAGGIWTGNAWLGTGLMTAGAAVLAAAVAPIDAARLDIVHPRMWGRGESGRMALRSAFEGSAPLLFGAMSGWLGGGARGLMWTFLVMLSPMLVASSLAFPARRTYPRDVATAAASVEATAPAGRRR
jgi:predicted MFS family arabinose efflux permease